MAIDEPTKRAWVERLSRENPDDCLAYVEKAKIFFARGNPIEVYVGGVFKNLLWFSYDLDERGNLMPSIQRLPLDYISNYRKVS